MNARCLLLGFAMAFVSGVCGGALRAQTYETPEPTVVPARFSASESPYSASTTPLSSVPPGVTVYYWPEIESTGKISPAPRSEAVVASYAPTNPYSMGSSGVARPAVSNGVSAPNSAPLQTTLRPVGSASDAAPQSNLECVCVPAGQRLYATPSGYGPHTVTMPPSAGGFVSPAPVYTFRQVSPGSPLPVSAMPAGYYFGHGLIGQPKVYVSGQPVRNALRFISP